LTTSIDRFVKSRHQAKRRLAKNALMRHLLALSAIALASVAAPVFTSSSRVIPFPDDYRQWTHVKSTLVGPHSASFESNGGYHHFYANAKAMEGYRTGTFPDGSILVDDGLAGLEKDGVTIEGKRRRLAVMVKDSRAFAGSAGWGFEWFPGDSRVGTLSRDGKAACLACHQRATRDLVYSQFRK
jgi:hypothetical protein